MNTPVILSGLAVGAGFGFALQCGRFCLNRACGNAFSIKEYTLLRAHVLALIVAVVAAHLLEQFGLLHVNADEQTFVALATAWTAMSSASSPAAGLWCTFCS